MYGKYTCVFTVKDIGSVEFDAYLKSKLPYFIHLIIYLKTESILLYFAFSCPGSLLSIHTPTTTFITKRIG